MNYHHKYDLIAPKIRAAVTRMKYGSLSGKDVAALLHAEAAKIEADYERLQQEINQGRLL